MTSKRYDFIDGKMVEIPADELLKRKNSDDEYNKKTKLLSVRDDRGVLLEEADHKINTLVDNNQDASAWRTYRQKLRDITKAEDLDNVTWPTKPS